MHDRLRVCRWVATLLLACATSAPGQGFYWEVGIGDECASGEGRPSPVWPYSSFSWALACFSPSTLAIGVGDRVVFYQYASESFTGPHNVVADDGSFRCARGCDGEGGDGTPGTDSICSALGCSAPDLTRRISFVRTFNAPGIVKYHDEVTGAPGIIYVGVQPPVPASPAISLSLTGTWFNAAQSGMGFMIEVLPGSPMQMLASWLTFSAQGAPSWIVGLGPIDGSRATLQATQIVGNGARFPPHFDRVNTQAQSWGTLTFTFSNCSNGRVDWVSALPGFGSGGMDLTRLTVPAGLSCSAAPTFGLGEATAAFE